MQDRISIIFTFFFVSIFKIFVSISRFFPMVSSFLLRDFEFINFNISFFLRDHNGNKALELFCAIAVAIMSFIYVYLLCNCNIFCIFLTAFLPMGGPKCTHKKKKFTYLPVSSLVVDIGIYRTRSRIYDCLRFFKSLTIFAKNLHYRCSTAFPNTPLVVV